MGIEIERKFLVEPSTFLHHPTRVQVIKQFYLSVDPCRTVRVRIEQCGESGPDGWLTVKGQAHGLSRVEVESEISVNDAYQLMELRCPNTCVVEKLRHRITVRDLVWEIDVFGGTNIGLVLAEVELPSDQYLITEMPVFVGEEVTSDPRYTNSNLSLRPFTQFWRYKDPT